MGWLGDTIRQCAKHIAVVDKPLKKQGSLGLVFLLLFKGERIEQREQPSALPHPPWMP